MSSAFWLLLYLAPLLGLTAALFAWFGWRWRGSDLLKQIKELQDEAGNERARHLGELKAAHESAGLHEDDAVKARESLQALETETGRLLRDLDVLRAERDQLRAQPAPVAAVGNEAPAAASTPPAEKPKRRQAAAARIPKAAAATTTLEGKIAAFEAELAAQQPASAALTQEHEGWQRRVGKLEGAMPADPAALALARRGLAESGERLRAATSEAGRLQKLIRVLRRAGENAAVLASVPDDDLTRIKGIKQVISGQLHAHGIRTWRQIARWDAEELGVFSELLAFKNRAEREKWREQARALHEAAHGPLS